MVEDLLIKDTRTTGKEKEWGIILKWILGKLIMRMIDELTEIVSSSDLSY